MSTRHINWWFGKKYSGNHYTCIVIQADETNNGKYTEMQKMNP